MIQQHIINTRHVQEMVNTIKRQYSGGFSNPVFNKDLGVPFDKEEDYLSYLLSLRNETDIIKDILEYVVGFGIFKAEGFREGDEVLYVNGSFEIDVTTEYLDAHFRYFEDGVE